MGFGLKKRNFDTEELYYFRNITILELIFSYISIYGRSIVYYTPAEDEKSFRNYADVYYIKSTSLDKPLCKTHLDRGISEHFFFSVYIYILVPLLLPSADL